MYDAGMAAGWSQGDFNYDGFFDVLDVLEAVGATLYDAGPYLSSSMAETAPIAEFQGLSATELAFAAIAIEAAAGDTTKNALRSRTVRR